ncbi:MFS4B-like protein [Mya arenaria]|uniref:MFS4B-like protein n=1 Tax=Mya arenaria TaxID=6604 RepID=A0ABY7EI06_MYAAR|nr:MFS4B-like protein [Mya arenaria]
MENGEHLQKGLFLEIGGPTMIDLRIRFNCTSEDVARSVSAQGFGIFIGALIGGSTVDAMGSWRFLLVTASVAMASLAVMAMPFYINLTFLWFMFLITGGAAGLINVAGQRILLELWRDKVASPMHAMHMGFGIGALISPLIINPFLAVLQFKDTSELTNTTSYPDQEFIVLQESRVQYAFVTIAICAAVLGSPFFVFPFVKCWRGGRDGYDHMDGKPETQSASSGRTRRFLDAINPASYAGGDFKYGLTVFIIILILYMNLVGGEQLFGNFIRTFSVDELKFPRNEASYLDTVYWGCFTLGRFTGSVLANCVSIRKLFIMDLFLNLTAITLADIFATRNQSTLWAFTAIVGFFIAPLFPAGISYINTQIEVSGLVLTLVVFASGFGHLFYTWVEGALYESYGPRTILYAMQFSSIFVCLIALVFVAISFKRGDRLKDLEQNLVVNSKGDDSTISADMGYTQLDQTSISTQSED